MVVSNAVEISHLRVAFASLVAVDDVSLHVDYGEVVTLLGPNGAGKTTVVETLLGFRAPSAGTVRLHGLDPVDVYKRQALTASGSRRNWARSIMSASLPRRG